PHLILSSDGPIPSNPDLSPYMVCWTGNKEGKNSMKPPNICPMFTDRSFRIYPLPPGNPSISPLKYSMPHKSQIFGLKARPILHYANFLCLTKFQPKNGVSING